VKSDSDNEFYCDQRLKAYCAPPSSTLPYVPQRQRGGGGVTREILLLQSLGDPLFTILVVYCFKYSYSILSQRCCYYSMGLLCIFSDENRSRSELSSSLNSSGSFSTAFWPFLCIFGLFSKFNLSIKPNPVVLRNSKTGLRFVSLRQIFGVMAFLLLYVI
jgi:hypothetical protein